MNTDKRIFDEWYETYFDDVYQYLLYFTNNLSEAEDLTQETFIKVYKNASQFQQKSSVKTWIFSIAKNTAVDHFRKKKPFFFLPDAIANLLNSKEGLPEQRVEENEEWQLLQQALLTLKPDYRNVIILRGVKEYSVKETAEILEWNESKVRVNYHRAVALLKKCLGQKNEEGGMFYGKESK